MEDVALPPLKRQKSKNHPCTYEGCSKSYTKPSKLEEHVYTHTGEVFTPNIKYHADNSVPLHVINATRHTSNHIISQDTKKPIPHKNLTIAPIQDVPSPALPANISKPMNLSTQNPLPIKHTPPQSHLTCSVPIFPHVP